jgi:hypothetical protein
VAFVQVAHRRHEGGAQLSAQLVAQFVDGGDDFHGVFVKWRHAGE